MGDRSLIYSPAPIWRRAHRLPMLATLTERRAGLQVVDDVTCAGGTDAERVWGAAEHILRDALEGAWLGSRDGSGRTVALRYSGPVLGDERAEWIDLTADLTALLAVCELLGYLTGYDYDWPWAPSLVGECVAEAA